MSKPRRVLATDRSMDAEKRDRSQLFFFPKQSKPTAVRAANRAEAEKLLEAPNPQEND